MLLKNNEYYSVARENNSVLITVYKTNRAGETLKIDIQKCIDSPAQNSLAKTWAKRGYIDRVLDTYWSVETYVTDSEGVCYGRYNPQIKRCETTQRRVINFDWMLEATEPNLLKLVEKIHALFMCTTEENATALKIKAIYNYAKANALEVVIELPEGYNKRPCATDPSGSITIKREGERTRKLLII